MASFSKDAFREELSNIGAVSGAPSRAPLRDARVADALDRADKLAPLRADYVLPRMRDITGNASVPEEKPALYLCGNSLGPLCRRSKEYVAEELDAWGRLAVNGHFDHVHGRPWVCVEERVSRFSADIVGAKRSEVAVMASLTQNLHTMLASFYRPAAGPLAPAGAAQRTKIVYEHKAFASDKYALDSVCRLRGQDPTTCLVPLVPRAGEFTLRTDDILQTIGEVGASGDGALVLLGGIQYFTGQFFELARITDAAHRHGMIMGVDLAHAFANVPLALHDWGVDFAVWCSYKYGSGGPGGIAGLFVHEKWGSDKHVLRFAMPEEFDPIPGAPGWQLSNPSVLDVSVLMGSLETLWRGAKLAATPAEGASLDTLGSDEDVAAIEARGPQHRLGVGRIMPAFRAKSERLTAYLELLLSKDGFDVEQLGVSLRIVTPEDPAQRGSQLCVLVRDPGAAPVADAAAGARTEPAPAVAPSAPRGSFLAGVVELLTKERGLVCDIRNPDVLRLAPLAQYTTYTEVFRAADALAWAMAQHAKTTTVLLAPSHGSPTGFSSLINMVTAAASALGYAGFGFLARCFALGIQKRNIMDNFMGHVAFMGAFGAAGYWIHGVKRSQEALLERKEAEIKARRAAAA
ncbi:kynureninase [Malassezia sp. CBS 17886]|nr:kynureninase [Malassezia sp. CBS 17886]